MRWPLISLGEVTQDRPICYGVLKPGPKTPGGVPLIRVTDISKHKLDFSDLYHISEDLSREFRRSVLNGTEVLLSIQGTVGKCALASPEIAGANISRTIAQIQPDSRLNRSFLRYWFLHKESRHQISGATRASLNIGSIRKYKIPLPPLEEQKRIAGILDEADRVRKKTQALIDKYDELAQSLFLDMFGDPVTNPKGWDELPVANFVETIIDYRGKTPPKSPQGIPLLSSANVHKGKIDLSYKQFISQEDFEKWTVRGFTQPKDLLFTTEAPVGEVAVIPDDGNTYQISRRVMAMRFKDSLMNSDFALFVMSSQNWASRLKKLTRGSTVPRVLKPDVLNQLMIAPPLREQLRFAEANQTLLNQQERACTALQVSSTCFDSLLQMAFKGELT